MSSVKEKYAIILRKYIPTEFVGYVTNLLIEHTLVFKIVKPRKTKLGDFRMGSKAEKPQITINGDLNPYSFLITTLHEFAHLKAFEQYGRQIAPHGKEWKRIFSELLIPIINSKKLPETVESALMNSLVNVKASSCTDINLQRVLITFDKRNDNLQTLESLNKNSTFELRNKRFIKGTLRRTRFLCIEQSTKKQYLVNRLAMVKEIKDEK